jgi:hypothetical protein
MATSQLNIGKFDAIRQKLERAIRLVLNDEDSISADTLAFDAYRVLREMLGDEATRERLITLEDRVRLGEIPGFTRQQRTTLKTS